MRGEEILSAVMDELAGRVAVRLLTLRGGETYSSCDLPPRCSRRRFAELCRSGRVGDAHREGRDWICSRDAWHAARARKPATPQPQERCLSAKADALLARSGLRVVKGTR